VGELTLPEVNAMLQTHPLHNLLAGPWPREATVYHLGLATAAVHATGKRRIAAPPNMAAEEVPCDRTTD
jgi:hypothetical protein